MNTQVSTRRPITRPPASAPARRLTIVALTAALAVAAAGCGSAASPAKHATSAPATGPANSGAFPVTIKAANGSVHIASRPTAIISLSPSATEMLYAIGAGRQVKAVDDDSDYPPGVPRTRLSGLTPNVEAIVAYKPDLVVTYNASAPIKRLAALGIPVLELPAPTNLDGVYAEIDQLGMATGLEHQAGAEVTTLRAEISSIVAAVPHHTGPLTYYYELDQTYYSVTSDTFIGKLLALLGMKSIADAAKGAADGYPQLSAEYILRANPGYIILADTICCHQDAATVAARPGWSALAAVKDSHVIALNDDIASRWGPRIVDLLEAVLAAIKGRK
jgi:cobalamin transport system substrate-binding protein